MDMLSIAKEYLDLQKRATNNFFDAVTLFQDIADKPSQFWIDQMGVNEKVRSVLSEWRLINKKGYEDSRRMANSGFTNVNDYFNGITWPKKNTSENQASSAKNEAN
jgi:hypothetical protein